MAPVSAPKPVLVLVAIISRHERAFAWACERIETSWGPIALKSEGFEHRETAYYEPTMGADLRKWFVALEEPVDPTGLADWKLQTNQWELDYAALGEHAELRPLNLDPGYITEAKVILATTKDREHRLYLRNGIYAEVTLRYQGGAWRNQPWTYPDYQRADFHAFFLQCREHLRAKGRQTPSPN